MAKAEWVELSQSSGSGDAAVAVSSKQAYTGREARTSIITWVAEDVAPIERTVIQEGAEVNTTLKGGTIITTASTRLTITGYSNEAGLGFRKPESNPLPYTVDTVLYVAGLKVIRKDGEMTMIPGDPGARQTYRFEIGITINPTGEEPPLVGIKGSLAIDGASGKSTLLRIIWASDENKYIIVPEGDIVIDALGTPVTVQVESNTNWVIELCMAILQREWEDGDSLAIRYEADGEDGIGTATFLSDANEGTDREMTITFKGEGVDGEIAEERKVVQEGKREEFNGSDGVFLDKNGDRFLVLKEEYKQD